MDKGNKNNIQKHGKFFIVHKKIHNNEFMLLELENSGFIKIKYNTKGITIVTYTSSSAEISQLYFSHEELMK